MKTNKVIRADGLEMGFITNVGREVPKCSRAYQGSGRWMATSNNGGCKYFVRYNNAVRWLERQNKNIYPISRLGEFIK